MSRSKNQPPVAPVPMVMTPAGMMSGYGVPQGYPSVMVQPGFQAPMMQPYPSSGVPQMYAPPPAYAQAAPTAPVQKTDPPPIVVTPMAPYR